MAKVTLDEEFSILGGPWEPMYPWSPYGWASDNSWLGNPEVLPPDANPIALVGGVMTLTDAPAPADVAPEQIGGLHRIAGQILTQNTFAQTYGYFEASIQMPSGNGENGAFWLLPENGQWPPELDIAEVEGGNLLINTLHTENGTPHGAAQASWVTVPGAAQGFNTYAVDWTPSTITWYYDGQQTFQVATPADMNQPMYLVFSLNSTGNDPGDQTSQMKIDWVHVYASNPYTSGGVITEPDPPASGGPDIVDVASLGSALVTAPVGPATFVYDGTGQNTVINGFDPAVDKIDFEMTTLDWNALSIQSAADGHAMISFADNQISLPGVAPADLTGANFLINGAH